MALIIEDGSGVANANSYVTAAQWDAWATARGISHSHSTSKIEEYILTAMDYFEAQYFIGRKATDEQELQWPRTEVYIDSYSVDSDEIPKQVKNAVYEITRTVSDGNFALSARERQTTQEKIGDITVTYKNNASMRKETPAVTSALRKITKSVNAVSRS
jgi:hypothetical protein